MTLLHFSARLGKLSLAFTTGLVLVFTGCSSTRARPEWMQTIAFWDKKEVDDSYRGEIPAKRVEKMREEAKRMSTLPPAEQQAKADRWAQEFRNEADPLIRAELVKAIATCGAPAAADTIRAAMIDSTTDVRIAACDAWGKHGGPQAVPSLSLAIRKDSSVDVRLAGLRALGAIGGPESIAALGTALDDEDPAMQYRAIQSLRKVTGKDFGDDVASWREFAKGGAPQEISVVQRAKLDVF
jgi:HEAT repeat protein